MQCRRSLKLVLSERLNVDVGKTSNDVNESEFIGAMANSDALLDLCSCE